MKRFILSLWFIFCCIFFSYCSSSGKSPTNKATLKLNITGQSSASGKSATKTIQPENMSVAAYTISGTGPNGATFSQNTSQGTTEVEVTAFGSWAVQVDAKNANGIILQRGGQTAIVSAGEVTNVNIALSAVEGWGAVNITVNWLADIASPAIDANLLPYTGNAIPLVFTISGKTATCLNTEIPAGYYTLTLKLLHGSTIAMGAVEIVRIVTDATTTGVYNFNEVNLTNSNSTSIRVNITPEANDPLTVTMSGQFPTLNLGSSMAVTASVQGSTGNMAYIWYINGISKGTGNSYSVSNLQTGVYNLGVIAFTADGKRAGDKSYTFKVVDNAGATFFDDFNGTAVDESKWQIATWQEESLTGRERCYVQDGKLNLVFKNDNGTFLGAAIQTWNRFMYGRWEARLKPTNMPGVLNSLYTIDWDNPATPTPADDGTKQEIDMEFLTNSFGSSSGQVHHAVHAGGNTYFNTNPDISLGFNPSDDFHVYAIDITPERIQWLVDGNVVQTYTYNNMSINSPYQLKMNVYTQNGGWVGGPPTPAVECVYQIDWIRFTPYEDNSGGEELFGWQLNETNTGLKGDYSKLTLLNPADVGYIYGDVLYVTQSNITISNKQIPYVINLQNTSNVTFDKCRFQPASCGVGDLVQAFTVNTTFQDCEFDYDSIPLDQVYMNTGVAIANGKVIRCTIHGSSTGLKINNTSSTMQSVVEGNYIYGLRYKSPAHMDGIVIHASSGAGSTIKNNRVSVESSEGATGPLFVVPYQSFIDNVTVQGNLLQGYGYSLILESRTYGYGWHMYAINNRLDPLEGWYRYVDNSSQPSEGPYHWSTWSDNYAYNPNAQDAKGIEITAP